MKGVSKYREIIIAPILTEKTTPLSEEHVKEKVYVFKVRKDANKIEIKKAVEERFGVKVKKVNTAIMPSKRKVRYTKKGVIRGKKPGYKKAYVKLYEGEVIDLFNL